MPKYGVGIIGLRMGRSHVVAFKSDSRAEVRAVCDIDTAQADKVASEHDVPVAVTDYRDLLKRDDVEIVSICSPDHLHAEHVVAALQAGKHVLCEKPLALTIADCRKMIDAWHKTDCQFMVGQVCRYAPGFRLAKRIIELGEIGELFSVESEYAHDYTHVGGVGGWRKDPKIKRPAVVGGGCHAVDLLRWIAGDIDEAFAYANHKMLPDWPVDDTTIGVLRFANGIVGKVFVSISVKRPYTMRSVFYGSKGTIITDNTSPAIRVYRTDFEDTSRDFSTIPVELASHNVASEVRELLNALDENRPVATSAIEGAKTVATCLAIVESAATGKPVRPRALLDL